MRNGARLRHERTPAGGLRGLQPHGAVHAVGDDRGQHPGRERRLEAPGEDPEAHRHLQGHAPPQAEGVSASVKTDLADGDESVTSPPSLFSLIEFFRGAGASRMFIVFRSFPLDDLRNDMSILFNAVYSMPLFEYWIFERLF